MGLNQFSVFSLTVSIVISGQSVNDFKRLTRTEFESLNTICGKSFISNYPRGPVQRVAFGSSAKPGEFPWAVSISTNKGFCSGTIISKYHIVTAAHCIIDNNVYPGSFPLDFKKCSIFGWALCAAQAAQLSKSKRIDEDISCSLQEKDERRFHKIRRIIVPQSSLDTRRMDELINSWESVPDVAVLELENPISDMDYELLPICVPGINTKMPETYTAYGYGRTENGVRSEVLLKLPVESYKHRGYNKCRWNYAGQCLLTADFILGNNDGSTCRGDSGGTFSGFVDGKEYLFGVLSLSTFKNCNITSVQPWLNTFTVTRIAPYSDFLCFYTGVCPLGYDVYSEWNYEEHPEPVLFFSGEDYKKHFDKGDFVVPVRRGKAE